jgi:hypothetical protein
MQPRAIELPTLRRAAQKCMVYAKSRRGRMILSRIRIYWLRSMTMRHLMPFSHTVRAKTTIRVSHGRWRSNALRAENKNPSAFAAERGCAGRKLGGMPRGTDQPQRRLGAHWFGPDRTRDTSGSSGPSAEQRFRHAFLASADRKCRRHTDRGPRGLPHSLRSERYGIESTH